MNLARLHPSTKVERKEDLTVLTFADRKRHLGGGIAEELDGFLDGREGGQVLLNLKYVTMLTGGELGGLVGLHKQLAVAGGRLTLCNVSELVYEVFQQAGLENVLRIYRGEVGQMWA